MVLVRRPLVKGRVLEAGISEAALFEYESEDCVLRKGLGQGQEKGRGKEEDETEKCSR